MYSSHISVKRGDTLKINFIWSEENTNIPLNLTGCSARLHIRNSRTKELLIDANTDNGRLTIEGALGLIKLVIDSDDMANLPIGLHVFDLELIFTDGSVLSSETQNLEILQDITI